MENAKSLNKFKQIEKLIKSLKKDGCKVSVVDNDRLVLEFPETFIENEKRFAKEVNAVQFNKDRQGDYAREICDVGVYDYQISIH